MNSQQYQWRRVRAKVSPVHINLLHYKNPWIVVAWSFIMPGFGHLLLGQYVLGWLLFSWELGINVYTHFNVAIIYSFTGHFGEAKTLLDGHSKWFILAYGSVFVFTLLSGYKMAVESNEMYAVIDKENTPIAPFSINMFQYNYLTKQSPVVAALWALMMPGLGAIWTRRVVTAVFEIGWWLTILWQSNLLGAIEYAALGKFRQATSVLNPEWVMFAPSIYGFLYYYSYTLTVELNKLFDKEQATFLKNKYQANREFPLYVKDDTHMRFVATFEHSIYLEQTIVTLESIGVARTNIFATSLDRRNDSSVWFDTLQRSDGKASLDVVALFGALGCSLGTIYGFVLSWGPVIWGLLGFGAGSLAGAVITAIKFVRSGGRRNPPPKTEVVVIVDCEEGKGDKVEEILWSHKAFGLARIV